LSLKDLGWNNPFISNNVKRNDVSAPPKDLYKKNNDFKDFNNELKEEINFLRTNLKEYINKLQYWKAFLKTNRLNIPKKPTISIKDPKSLDELINFLKTRLKYSGALSKLENDEKLFFSANDFINILQKHDETNEFNSLLVDKNGFVSRLRKYANPIGLVGESVSLHDTDTEVVILKLLLGEEDPNKTDREIFLSKKMKFFGVASGVLHRSRTSISVIDFCEDYEKEKVFKGEELNSQSNFLTKNNGVNMKKVVYKLNYNETTSREFKTLTTNHNNEYIKVLDQNKNNSMVIDTHSDDNNNNKSFNKARYRSLNISLDNLNKASKFIDKIRKNSPSIQCSILNTLSQSNRVNTITSNVSNTNSKISEETIQTNDTNSCAEKNVVNNDVNNEVKGFKNESNTNVFHTANRKINKNILFKDANIDSFSNRKSQSTDYH
jgi:hypothetical protein